MQSNDERESKLEAALENEDAYFQSLDYEEQSKLIQQTLEDLEREGLVKRTGEYRKGRSVYTLTKYGTA